MDSFVHSFQAIKDLPHKERMQWKEWFDHYVFKLHGNPYEHIEQRYQGLYGKTNSYRKKKLRRKLNGILVKKLSKSLVKKNKKAHKGAL